MATFYTRGGLPVHIKGQATGVKSHWEWSQGVSNFLIIENRDATDKLFVAFSEDDIDNDRTITIPAAIGTNGNPARLPVETGGFWIKAEGANPVDFSAIVFVRRG